MRLTQLAARWVVQASDDGSFRKSRDDPQPAAFGVMFLCPKCFADNGGEVGTHSVIVPFADRGVPTGFMPTMPRWSATGETLETLTTKPSIAIQGGCGWHGWITDGDAS